jgi:magnesium and cobalt exporter, CNNM family
VIVGNFSLTTLFLILIGLVLISAFFSGAEIGMMSLNPYRLRHLVKKKNKKAIRVHQLLSKPERLLGVVLIGNTFANIIASAVATLIGQRLKGDVGVFLATIILTFVVLIFAEMAPKTFAALSPQRIAFVASRPLQWLLIVFAPLVKITNVLANGLLRLFGVTHINKPKESLSGEELRTVLHETGGLIPDTHKKMLVSILDLEYATVEDIMVPRNDIVGIDLDLSWDEILEQLETAQHTRLPLYRDCIENLEGIIHIRKILNLLVEKRLDEANLLQMADTATFIPEETALHEQLLNFQKGKSRSGFVVDEYGDIKGLVALEDILEEIVGEFTTDMAASTKEVTQVDEGVFLINGSASIRELNRVMGWNLPNLGPRTLSGLITEFLGYIPPSDCCVKIGDYRIEILKLSHNKIHTVKLSLVRINHSRRE